MKKLFTLALFCFVTCIAYTQDYKQLDTLLETLSNNTKIMGNLSIIRNGAPVYDKSVGYRRFSEGNKTPSNTNTKYRIGSITKTFTATLIFQLIDDGKITLDDKLSKYFPDIKNASNITIHHLLTHRSGLYNITNADDIGEWIYKPSTIEMMLSRIRKQDTVFNPGEKNEYSNTNFLLLGYIIEAIENKSLETVLTERIIEPLNLKQTYYGHKIEVNNNECESYQYRNETWSKSPETEMSNPGGAGAIVSSSKDLTLFMDALFNNKLMSAKSFKTMITPYSDDYCSGLFYSQVEGQTIYGHDGSIDGFHSMLIYIPEHKIGVAFTANALNYSKMAIMLHAVSVSLGKTIVIPTFNTIALTADEVKQFEGIYESKALPFDLVFEAHGTILKGAPEASNLKELVATKKNEFRFDTLGIIIKFNPEEQTLLFTRGDNPTVLFTKKQ
jgi:CubicO group peptidase (beta-lactamase class C family)